jgi:hypothetical protein
MDRESYKVLVLSTAHLRDYDIQRLTHKARDPENNMVMERDTGFFVKLYDNLDYDQDEKQSLNFNVIVATAHNEGFRMLEFDRDAPVYDDFSSYELP